MLVWRDHPFVRKATFLLSVTYKANPDRLQCISGSQARAIVLWSWERGGYPNPWEGGDSSKPMLDYAADE